MSSKKKDTITLNVNEIKTIYTKLEQSENEYINIQEKKHIVIETVTKKLLDTREDKWWLDDALDIYSKDANIRQLRREKLIRSPKAFKQYCDLADFQPDWCPCTLQYS